ncbi:multicopper oxidase family protein [Acinetobacter rudis]|uniref:multicopper oxidase family protein n=1 Tax=Acinetobacter rudis TaxID=632955 RepID=UPI0028106F19|nr:multicopper oxidase family protein [Acinetobacter rudis]MDQ8952188.1 multicopper oxidase family protein [Acinetobacter rudis]
MNTRIIILTLLFLEVNFKVYATDQILQDPPAMQINRSSVLSPSNAKSDVNRKQKLSEASFTWDVRKIKSKLWNPATQHFDSVILRGYQGTNTSLNTPFVAPTIEIFPGETLKATLNNQLNIDPRSNQKTGADQTCSSEHMHTDQPHCFDTTNMHTHGLWVSPRDKSDNVFVSISPGTKFQYEYNIAEDHPAGTFWYHPHRHGSTAIQVGSGMAGALIIRGNRQPTANKTGDLDLLTKGFKERILLFQQIQYACYNNDGTIKTNSDGSYFCGHGDIGEIRDYQGFGAGNWTKSGRYTSINGEIQPLLTQAVAGKVERWRMIHAGVRDSINLTIRLMQHAPNKLDLTTQSEKKLLKENCTGPVVNQYIIANDGLTLKQIHEQPVTVLQPSYRYDALIQFPQKGRYCIINESAPASANVDRVNSERRLMAVVHVNAANPTSQTLTDALIEHANQNINLDMRKSVINDLQNNLKLSHFVPHPDLPQTPYKQQLEFNIDNTQNPPQFQIDGKPFQLGRVDRDLKLERTDEWTLTSKLASHPFHIHINPFQIIAIYDPNGKDVSAIDSIDDYDKSAAPDPQYRGLKGSWKDTILVKNVRGASYKVIFRTKYQRYTGDFVLHCHILDHEDQGMMQHIRISSPNDPQTQK